MNTSAQKKVKYTEEEYFALVEEAEKEGKRYEYHDGKIFLISDSSITHSRVLSKVHGTLFVALQGKPCEAVTSSLKVNVDTNSFYCYPDIVVVCGEFENLKGHNDILTNPTVIIEILSPSTMDYDRGEKFGMYRKIPSLKEYVCISSLKVAVEKYTRKGDFQWLLQDFYSIDDSIVFESLGITLSIADRYQDIDFSTIE